MEEQKMSSTNATLITGGRDCAIRCWNPRLGTQISKATDHTGWIFTITRVDESRFASSGYDETIHIYNLPWCSRILEDEEIKESEVNGSDDEEEGEEEEKIGELEKLDRIGSIQSFTGHTNTVRCLASFPWHGTLVSGSDDKTIKVWSLKKSKCVKTIKKMHRDTVKDITSVGKNYFLSGSDDHTVLKWSLKKLRKPIRVLSLTSFVSKLLYLDDLDITFVAMNNCIGVLDKNLVINRKFVHERPVSCLNFDKEHNVLITGDRKGYITMWDLRKSEIPCYHQQAHTDYITGIAVLNNEEYVTTSLQRPNSMKYWKFNRKTSTKDIDVNCDGIWSMVNIGENISKEIPLNWLKDVEERINWLIEESDEEDDGLIEKLKFQFFDRHMYVSKVFLLF